LVRIIAETAVERELARTKAELVAMVTHELASPATNLVAYAELLATHDHPESEQQEMLATMVLEGQRMTAIIQDFLDVLRLESGRVELATRPTNLLALLEHAATIAKRDADHRLRVDLPATLSLVQADPGRVQQILANLLSNARKYTPAGREIRLGARQVVGAVEVYVADDGDSLYTPALLYLHAAVFSLFGGSPVVDVRIVGLVGRLLLTVALYLLCRPQVRPAIAVLPSLYIQFGLDRLPSTWEPHPGWPSAALTVVAAWGYRRLPTLSGARRVTLLVAIGAIAGLVFAFKQNAGVLLGLALVVSTAWQGIEGTRTDVTRALRALRGLQLLLFPVVWRRRPG